MQSDPTTQSPDVEVGKPVTIWRVLLWVGVILLVIFLVWIVAAINTWRKLPESYAAWTTGNLIVEYLYTHTNQWPKSWHDLEQSTNCQRYVPIEQLREQVRIDWNADVAQLLLLAQSNRFTPLTIVTRPDGSRLHAVWGKDTEPDRKIIGYLRWSLNQSNALTTGAP
jgi:hypothetical protein